MLGNITVVLASEISILIQAVNGGYERADLETLLVQRKLGFSTANVCDGHIVVVVRPSLVLYGSRTPDFGAATFGLEMVAYCGCEYL